ncbi:MAG: amidohydrolase family protein [Erysipelotrichaceae bacterium]|nr:amidohydrolase family protein [Erysipelotrichaceae bacterium]
MKRDLDHADLLIRNVKVFNSYFKTFYDADVYIKNGKFLYIDKDHDGHLSYDASIDGKANYMIPGLIDIHMHIESSMVTPEAFCRYTAKNGMTSIVSEPHEIANVCGIQGVKAMIASSKDTPYDCFFAIPSNVPILERAYETSGGTITCQDMLELKKEEKVLCLGEVMNYTQIIEEDDSEAAKFIEKVHAEEPSYPLEGHCPALKDLDLAKYLYLGIGSDHCTHDPEELKQRFENGMFVQLQDVMVTKEVIAYVCEHGLYEYFSFVTDDTLPDVLVNKGHLDAIVRKAVSFGMRPEEAVYCATHTPARRMGLNDRGVIAPGKLADFVLCEEIEELKIVSTYKKGRCIYDAKKESEDVGIYDLDGRFEQSVVHGFIKEEDLQIFVGGKDREVAVRVMKLYPENNRSDEVFVRMNVKDGKLLWKDSGSQLVLNIERYGRDGRIAFGFSTGCGLKAGACASSYAHDSHDLIAMGNEEKDLVRAVNEVIRIQGGIVTVLAGEITSKIELPIAGLLSKVSVEETAKRFSQVRKAFDAQGYEHLNNIMNFTLIALSCIPTLKLTDRGYLDTLTLQKLPLYEEIED